MCAGEGTSALIPTEHRKCGKQAIVRQKRGVTEGPESRRCRAGTLRTVGVQQAKAREGRQGVLIAGC